MKKSRKDKRGDRANAAPRRKTPARFFQESPFRGLELDFPREVDEPREVFPLDSDRDEYV